MYPQISQDISSMFFLNRLYFDKDIITTYLYFKLKIILTSHILHPNNPIFYDLASHKTQQHTGITQELHITIKHVFQWRE